MLSPQNKLLPHNPKLELSQPNATSNGTENININRIRNEDVEAANTTGTNKRGRFAVLDRLRKLDKALQTPIINCYQLTIFLAWILLFFAKHDYDMATTMSTIDPNSTI